MTLTPVDPRLPEPMRLVAELDQQMRALYANVDHVLTPIEGLVAAGAYFLLAEMKGNAVGCGALIVRAGEGIQRQGEILRMYVDPEARGQGVGRALLAGLETEARRLGLSALILEAGTPQPDAVRLYRRAGFQTVDKANDYPPEWGSLFMEKRLTP